MIRNSSRSMVSSGGSDLQELRQPAAVQAPLQHRHHQRLQRGDGEQAVRQQRDDQMQRGRRADRCGSADAPKAEASGDHTRMRSRGQR